ncbi:hypothetical protein EVAR_87289_1 [Eumeta japonica]|uniref:Uncharacterized protein n=1 Tax=Eumeta variegata TaxID=151549 RepID=A0A4C1VWG2_EUMVA|nr:hypothetical protein EVAR_87289_1 [Eumeta japonica]
MTAADDGSHGSVDVFRDRRLKLVSKARSEWFGLNQVENSSVYFPMVPTEPETFQYPGSKALLFTVESSPLYIRELLRARAFTERCGMRYKRLKKFHYRIPSVERHLRIAYFQAFNGMTGVRMERVCQFDVDDFEGVMTGGVAGLGVARGGFEVTP